METIKITKKEHELLKSIQEEHHFKTLSDATAYVINEYAKRILKGDLEFAKRTERAWKEYDKGRSKPMKAKDFLKELKKW